MSPQSLAFKIIVSLQVQENSNLNPDTKKYFPIFLGCYFSFPRNNQCDQWFGVEELWDTEKLSSIRNQDTSVWFISKVDPGSMWCPQLNMEVWPTEFGGTRAESELASTKGIPFESPMSFFWSHVTELSSFWERRDMTHTHPLRSQDGHTRCFLSQGCCWDFSICYFSWPEQSDSAPSWPWVSITFICSVTLCLYVPLFTEAPCNCQA